jgi:bacterioferritin
LPGRRHPRLLQRRRDRRQPLGRRLGVSGTKRRAKAYPRRRRGAAAEDGMKGDPKVIDYLNRGLRSELTAVNQYWLHYRILDDWGFKDLAKKWREESIEEMRHADRFVERILFLEGFANMQVLDPLRIGQSIEEILQSDLAGEIDARALYLEAAQYCDSINDRVSKGLFEELAADEEGHIDFLETQLELVRQVGVQLYAQKHMGGLEE